MIVSTNKGSYAQGGLPSQHNRNFFFTRWRELDDEAEINIARWPTEETSQMRAFKMLHCDM